MRLPADALPADRELSRGLRTTLEGYAAQGGLLGAVVYALVDLETDDEELAATAAAVPTNLFVASALHDDAIDEANGWHDRKRQRNERITVGDLVFANVVEATRALPTTLELSSVFERIRAIGRGQLAEEAVDPSTVTPADAIERVDARGAVWGRLTVTLVDAIGDFSNAQLAHLRGLATDAMFVLTVVDDVEDLPEDAANGVASLPSALYEGDLTAYDSPAGVAEAFLASDAPDRLEAELADRRSSIEDDAVAFAESLADPETRVLESVRRALSWYCDGVCPIPVERTVPPSRERDLRARLAADDATKRRTIASAIAAWPIDPDALPVSTAALVDATVAQPAGPLADVLVMASHVATVADATMSTTLDEALATLERTASG